eukprot:Hpha_TRINITY_DN16199_c4_g4::TRINITY_DN16199_c4_g4_i1::g.7307::m.7307/K05673/ABCC4; ATP-binding cassette, subfamily C (CFTR/MRP), member 4
MGRAVAPAPAAAGHVEEGDVRIAVVHTCDEEPPYDVASWFSKMTFSFVRPTLRHGYKEPLEMENLPKLATVDHAKRTVGILEDSWQQADKQGKFPLWRSIVQAHRSVFISSGIYAFLESAVFIAQPILLRHLIEWLKDDSPFWIGAVLAGGIALAALAQAIVHHILYFLTMRMSMHLRIGCTGLINSKLMKISTAALAEQTTGKVINLVATDVLRFEQGMIMIHFGWMGIVDFFVCLWLIARLVGWGPACAGISVLLLTILGQVRSGPYLAKIRKITAGRTDKRVRVLQQVLSAVLTVKAFAWELPFAGRIAELRKDEANSIFRSQCVKAANLSLSFAGPVMTSLVTFAVYWAQGNELKPEVIYPTVGLFQVIRMSLGKKFSRFCETFPEMHVAVQRLQGFLMLEDVSRGVISQPLSDAVLELDGVSFRWPTAEKDAKPVLSGVTFAVRRGELAAVVGPVGSGKSAMLQGILGELSVDGAVRQAGSIAYAPQQAWIFAGTLRDNILFGSSYDEKRYNEVLRACALHTDVQALSDGDMTEIGEKGVNLSGGQKARVGLARAVYRQGTSLILIDDALAAVDPHVANHLLGNCLRSDLLKDVAVVLATHHEKAAEAADKVIALTEDGVAAPCRAGTAPLARTVAGAADLAEGKKAVKEEDDRLKLVLKEDRTQGAVSSTTYLTYAKAGGLWAAILVAMLLVMGQVAMIMADYWLKVWSDAGNQRDKKYVYVFMALCISCILTGFLRAILFFWHANHANSKIHDSAMKSVVGAPMSFFTANPLGRVVNRFSADVGQIDELLPVILFDCLQTASVVLGAIFLVCIVFVHFLAAIPVMFGVFWWLRRYATRSLRELKRLDGTSRSPFYARFTANLSGLLCIRAFGREEESKESFVGLLNANATAWYWWLLANRWVGFRLDMLATGVIVSCVGLALVLRKEVDAGMFGLATAYAMSLSGMLQYCVRQSAQVETFMTCVERVLHYATQLPQEGADLPPSAPEGFPASGEVGLQGLCVRYREDLPVVLRDVTATVPSGKKVGIVGRTGSGKSSLVQALLGLNEVCGGTLSLGGVDVQKLPLKNRRNAVSYIPQDPVLFQGSVRSNLDPFGDHPDSELKEVLVAARLPAHVDLETSIEEAGGNFSTGERQLFSLARAMLRRAPIVIMDEATASVDYETDALIQATIRSSTFFKGSTLLVIAHRLETVRDSDLILVFDAGCLVEHGPPQELLAKGGVFASLTASHTK